MASESLKGSVHVESLFSEPHPIQEGDQGGGWGGGGGGVGVGWG